ADGALPIEQIAVSHRDFGRLATYEVPRRSPGPAGRSVAVPHDRIEAVLKGCAGRRPGVEIERATVVGLARDAAGRGGGVRARAAAGERTYRAALVVGCDGSQSLVRRELGIGADRRPYAHELLYIPAEGATDPPGAMHFHLDPEGVILVASRPGRRMRIAIYFKRGARGDLLKRPDPALHEYVAGRGPPLAAARCGREPAHAHTPRRDPADPFR